MSALARTRNTVANDRAIVHVIDDDESPREALSLLFPSVGLDVRTYASVQEFVDAGLQFRRYAREGKAAAGIARRARLVACGVSPHHRGSCSSSSSSSSTTWARTSAYRGVESINC